MKTYKPDGATLAAFLRSPAKVKVIQGPIGSGKSVVCAMHVWQTALKQVKQADGKRRCRAHVFRDTYGKLEETTVPTWQAWFPPAEFGRFYQSKPFKHEVRVGDVELDVTFVALEDIRAVDFFKSLETTIIWYNELQYIERELFSEGIGRDRYPAMVDGGPVDPKVIADTNAPPSDHWLPIMRGDVPVPDWMSDDERKSLVKPEGWEFFVQPAGLVETRNADGEVDGYVDNPLAENRSGLRRNYYLDAIKGKPRSWINQNVMNRSDIVTGGKPVHPDYDAAVHLAPEILKPIRDLEIIVGLDFGRQPAALFMQCLRGRWYALRELIGRDMGAAKFAPMVRRELAQHFPGHRVQLWGDPSGDFRGQNDDSTPFQIFRHHGLMVRPAPSNLLTVRIQAVDAVLCRRHDLLVSRACTTFHAGMAGGYHFRRLAVAGQRYGDEPEKNQYSHICEAGGYAMLGGGEGRALLIGGDGPAKAVNTSRPYSVFDRARHGPRPLPQRSRLRRW
jgi:hypothetical protein